jgi:hypothetical protein
MVVSRRHRLHLISMPCGRHFAISCPQAQRISLESLTTERTLLSIEFVTP